jgi:hypothetical protein
MQRGPIILSIIIIAVISALVIAYYQSASTKAVAAQCDKTKKVCQIQSETTHFGGYFPVYSYYYLPFPLYGPGLGNYYPGSLINTPSVCDNCLNKITPQDEQDIQNSKAPVSQSDLPSDQQTHNLKVILIHQSQRILRSNHHHLKIHLRLNPQEVVVDKAVLEEGVEAKVAVVAAVAVEWTLVVVEAVEKGDKAGRTAS